MLDELFLFNSSYDDIFLSSIENLQIATEMVLSNTNIVSLSSTRNQDSVQSSRKKRRIGGVVLYITEEGETKVLPASMSTWYLIYIQGPALDNTAFHVKFRRRFRLPYDQYLKIVEDCRSSDLFKRWQNTDAVGKESHPLELLILTALRYLGRGWTFDDLSESTGISEEVIRVFFHTFIEYGSTILYNQHVIAPQNTFEAKSHSYEFEVAGLPGAIGSMDATHIILEKVSFKRRQSHLGFKHTCTARTYNIVVNHRRRILGTTDGHPARWNDKSIVRFDGIAMGLRNGTLLSDDFIFELYDYDKDGNVTKVKYKGPWLLVDNGYHNWPVTIPPFKATTSLKEVRFSNWLESIRKDVECTFGILKGRWRILKSGIRLQGVEPADKIWKTCCALHNLLLDVDGLDEKWEYGVPSDWEGALGNHDDYDVVYQMTLD
jgi:hypothetical protein